MFIRDVNELTSSQKKFGNKKGNSTRYNKFRKVLNKWSCGHWLCWFTVDMG